MIAFERVYNSKYCPFCQKICNKKTDVIFACLNCPHSFRVYNKGLLDDGIEIRFPNEIVVFYDPDATEIDIHKGSYYLTIDEKGEEKQMWITDITIPAAQFCYDINYIQNSIKTILNFS